MKQAVDLLEVGMRCVRVVYAFSISVRSGDTSDRLINPYRIATNPICFCTERKESDLGSGWILQRLKGKDGVGVRDGDDR